jgi:hypothetical protein
MALSFSKAEAMSLIWEFLSNQCRPSCCDASGCTQGGLLVRTSSSLRRLLLADPVLSECV